MGGVLFGGTIHTPGWWGVVGEGRQDANTLLQILERRARYFIEASAALAK